MEYYFVTYCGQFGVDPFVNLTSCAFVTVASLSSNYSKRSFALIFYLAQPLTKATFCKLA